MPWRTLARPHMADFGGCILGMQKKKSREGGLELKQVSEGDPTELNLFRELGPVMDHAPLTCHEVPTDRVIRYFHVGLSSTSIPPHLRHNVRKPCIVLYWCIFVP